MTMASLVGRHYLSLSPHWGAITLDKDTPPVALTDHFDELAMNRHFLKNWLRRFVSPDLDTVILRQPRQRQTRYPCRLCKVCDLEEGHLRRELVD